MERAGFEELIERLGAAWNRGDAAGAAACFDEAVDYADPLRYRLTSRADLLAFFEPPPRGHSVEWHQVLFDKVAQTGVLEYTYVGHHRYHGAVLVEIGPGDTIIRWREWQHVEDERDWAEYLRGPGG